MSSREQSVEIGFNKMGHVDHTYQCNETAINTVDPDELWVGEHVDVAEADVS